MVSAHHLKITLLQVKPAVWREVLVPSDLRLDRLHQVIQIVMGWEEEHMHEFIVGRRAREARHFGTPNPDFDLGLGPSTENEKQFTLQALAPGKGDEFRYWYDFGDDWMHSIVVKAIGEAPAEQGLPVCVKATGACPPEDCGGPPGYAHLQEALADPAHPEHADMRDWLGDEWEPSPPDLSAVNLELASLSARWKRTAPKSKSAPK
jgi:hypothetical protein